MRRRQRLVIAGNTGGVVTGGAGNDVLTANPTQTAANNAAKTTLDGGTGDNWLFGDGAYTTFDSGDNSAGTYNQIFGGAPQMTGVAGYENNTVSYAGMSSAYESAYSTCCTATRTCARSPRRAARPRATSYSRTI